jgi:hypothetical protein
MITTCGVIIGSAIPDPGEPHKFLAVAKVVVLNVLLISGGVMLYGIGRRRPQNKSQQHKF